MSSNSDRISSVCGDSSFSLPLITNEDGNKSELHVSVVIM